MIVIYMFIYAFVFAALVAVAMLWIEELVEWITWIILRKRDKWSGGYGPDTREKKHGR